MHGLSQASQCGRESAKKSCDTPSCQRGTVVASVAASGLSVGGLLRLEFDFVSPVENVNHSVPRFGAKVLVRPLTERAVTMVYLFKKPDAQQIWDDGWKQRPSLQRMVEYLNSTLSEGTLQS